MPTIVNSIDIQPKIKAKPGDIKLWYLCMRYLGSKNLKTLKNLNSRMDFNKTTLSKLCRDCRKGDRTCQPSRGLMLQVTKFLSQVYSNLEGSFLQTR